MSVTRQMLAAFDEVAEAMAPGLLADEERRVRAWEGVKRHVEACQRAFAEGEQARQDAHTAAMEALLSQATRTRAEPGGHNAVCARIDAGILRAKYGDVPVFPPAWDELRPKCKCHEWPGEEASDAK